GRVTQRHNGETKNPNRPTQHVTYETHRRTVGWRRVLNAESLTDAGDGVGERREKGQTDNHCPSLRSLGLLAADVVHECYKSSSRSRCRRLRSVSIHIQ